MLRISIQQLQAPLRLGGFGITSPATASHAAYLASVASTAVPYMLILKQIIL